jgi:hypothetical protein
MNWRTMLKILLAMALDDWNWRREQQRNARKLRSGQRHTVDHTASGVSQRQIISSAG